MVEIKAVDLKVTQKILLTMIATLLTSGVVFVFLFVWDGSNWGFVDDSLAINILILLGLGLMFSILYFSREFKNNLKKTIVIKDSKTTITDARSTRIYDNNQAINIRLDRQFYYFIKLNRLTITFSQMGIKNKRHESIIVTPKSVNKDEIIQALSKKHKEETNTPI